MFCWQRLGLVMTNKYEFMIHVQKWGFITLHFIFESGSTDYHDSATMFIYKFEYHKKNGEHRIFCIH